MVYTEDGGRFHVEFQNKWYTSVAPGANLVMSARYEDPKMVKLLTKIESVETKIESVETKIDNAIDNAVAQLKSYIRRRT